MGWYKLIVQGTGFPGALVGGELPVGFFTLRAVEAETPEDARRRVIESIPTDPTFQLPQGYQGPTQGRITFDTVQEITREHAAQINAAAISWYPMDAAGPA